MKHPENSNEYKGLTVNAGVENLPSVNPYATFRRKKQVLSVDEYVEGILRGDMRLLSQAVTLIESNLPSDQIIAQQVIEKCLPYAGNAIRLGITGVPGAGKSTFIEALAVALGMNPEGGSQNFMFSTKETHSKLYQYLLKITIFLIHFTNFKRYFITKYHFRFKWACP